MGYYIKTPGHAVGKADVLIRDYDAVEVPEPRRLPDKSRAIICVVENDGFDAAGVAHDAYELRRFRDRDPSGRPKRWLVMPRDDVDKLVFGVPWDYSDDGRFREEKAA